MSAPDHVVIIHPRVLVDVVPAFALLEAGRCVALLPGQMKPGPHVPRPGGGGPELAVTSSGSTGLPKVVWKPWGEVAAAASRSDAVQGWRWASPYDPWSFAGVQVALQAWISGGDVVSVSGDWGEVWRTLAGERIHALSCTPTFADLLIQNEPDPAVPWHPRQLTLGGEPLRARTGERLRKRWPRTRVVAIYASAEFGVLMKTGRVDGWYEVSDLEKRWPRWRIADGTLELGRDPGEWISTGDQVEQVGGLMRIVGRSDQVANVAGSKVSLAQVALLAEEVKGVRRARATARPNPVTGQVVALHFALEAGAELDRVRHDLELNLRSRLPKAAWPRDWVEDEVGLENNAKRAVA